MLERVPGIEKVLDKEGKQKYHLDHPRAGELIAVADKNSWFTYYFWLDDNKAPDYARTVDIHRKPGYDPVETLADPEIKFLKGKIGMKLLKKKLGFRYLMDVISLDASLVKGSHGRMPEDKLDWPIFVESETSEQNSGEIEPTEVFERIYKTVMR
ncbi:hypothetical protein B879_03185 [Cecembia lonarensis LW9]|uniref:Uncharacterized protein n=1 Tax=Cecembia lonarensis (strain CCUG 58316 / KCTC 22772 / LW9) TaxID=1225176 RepID=K1LVT9_CECL9|nr:hypothetical protein B879_03185 [Cecembia lonarensis LW9]